jgi:hypothetical protein
MGVGAAGFVAEHAIDYGGFALIAFFHNMLSRV